jgi:hypothetical protein
MREEVYRMNEAQKNLTVKLAEQEKEIAHKDSLIERFRETYESNGQE